MKTLLDFFSSVKLTIALLLGLSLCAIGGTIWPVEQGSVQRFDLYYQSIWFRLLLGLFALNLAACTWKTFARVSKDKTLFLSALEKTSATNEQVQSLQGKTIDNYLRVLKGKGYHINRHDKKALARKGLCGRWSLPVMHLSILVIMLGALSSELGFVGTLNIYVNHQSETYFDWKHQEDLPLGFTFRLDHFEPQYYPIDIRFATFRKGSEELISEYTATEGETVQLSPNLSAQVIRFYPEEEHLVLGLIRDGILIGQYHGLGGGRNYPNRIEPGFEIRPTAFRDPILKQLHSEVSIIENGQVVRQGLIRVNEPLVHRGVAIYQTVFSRDESGFWVCGFQFSKDPGEMFVWIGSLVLVVTLLLVFMVRQRAVGLIVFENSVLLVPLAGFRGNVGKSNLSVLKQNLDQQDL